MRYLSIIYRVGAVSEKCEIAYFSTQKAGRRGGGSSPRSGVEFILLAAQELRA